MKRVAVLRGGPSAEYDVSMLTGRAVLDALDAADYAYKDITISKAGNWLEQGRKRTPMQALQGVDVVFLALHGEYGEDGQVQRILEQHNIPFTGSRALASGVAFNKELAKQTLRPHNIKLAKHRRVRSTEKPTLKDEVAQIIADIGTELFIKPVANGSSFGARRVMEEVELHDNLVELLDLYDDLLVEEYIGSQGVAVAVLEEFRGEALYTFPVSENNTLNHPSSTVTGFSNQIKQEMANLARLAHTKLGCAQYSLVSLVPLGDQVYFSSLKTHPDFTGGGLYAQAAESVGLPYTDLIMHLVNSAKF